MPDRNDATTVTIPANTLAWTSWTVSNSTIMDGFANTFPIAPQNYNSSVVAAVYINGVLDNKNNIHHPSSSLAWTGLSDVLGHYSTGFQGRTPETILSPDTVVSIAYSADDATHRICDKRRAHLRVESKFTASAASIFSQHFPV